MLKKAKRAYVSYDLMCDCPACIPLYLASKPIILRLRSREIKRKPYKGGALYKRETLEVVVIDNPHTNSLMSAHRYSRVGQNTHGKH